MSASSVVDIQLLMSGLEGSCFGPRYFMRQSALEREMASLCNQLFVATSTSTIDVEFKLVSVCEAFAFGDDTFPKLRAKVTKNSNRLKYKIQRASPEYSRAIDE